MKFWTILPAGHLDHELYDVDVVMQVGWDTWQSENIVEFCKFNFAAKFYYFSSYSRDAIHSSYEPHKSSRIKSYKVIGNFLKVRSYFTRFNLVYILGVHSSKHSCHHWNRTILGFIILAQQICDEISNIIICVAIFMLCMSHHIIYAGQPSPNCRPSPNK